MRIIIVEGKQYRVQFISRGFNENDYHVMPIENGIGQLDKEERIRVNDNGETKGSPDLVEAVRDYEIKEYAEYVQWATKKGYEVLAPTCSLVLNSSYGPQGVMAPHLRVTP